MQAAAKSLPGVKEARRRDFSRAKPHLATADDAALLGALPIAAAVIGRKSNRCLRVLAHNAHFTDTVEGSTCTALDWNTADCLTEGPIAALLQDFFDDSDTSGELDFRDGDGVAAR